MCNYNLNFLERRKSEGKSILKNAHTDRTEQTEDCSLISAVEQRKDKWKWTKRLNHQSLQWNNKKEIQEYREKVADKGWQRKRKMRAVKVDKDGPLLSVPSVSSQLPFLRNPEKKGTPTWLSQLSETYSVKFMIHLCVRCTQKSQCSLACGYNVILLDFGETCS